METFINQIASKRTTNNGMKEVGEDFSRNKIKTGINDEK